MLFCSNTNTIPSSLKMSGAVLCFVLLLVHSVFLSPWQKNTYTDAVELEDRRDVYRFNSKRPMGDHNILRRMPEGRFREARKKDTGHLMPVYGDEGEDEVVSVAIGPPPMRPKHYYGHGTRYPPQPGIKAQANFATNLVKDVLNEIVKEFISRQVSEEFVFGQYIGNAMKNLTKDLKIKMQHDALDLIVKYQNWNREEKGEAVSKKDKRTELKTEKKANETEEAWVDFSNLASIMSSTNK